MALPSHRWKGRSARPPTMSLIHTTTRSLELFDDDLTAPQYVALSYCWRYGERRLLDNLYDPQAVFQGHAFPGLDAACLEALRRGVDYIWVDTCCIAQTSSIRPAAIINPKFRRYQKSVACFAYLDDLDSLGNANLHPWESRWFTCAWTLQALIAAREVEFYDHSWTLLGTKLAMLQALSMQTEVDSRVLADSKCLCEIPIGKRIAWATRRKTRRIEDVAYSLSGLFGLRMKVIYGEGDRAFFRLQRKISQTFNDGSLFMWQSSSTQCYHNLLAKSPSGFAHFTRNPPSEPLVIQIAIQLSHPKNRVHGLFIAKEREAGHLLMSLPARILSQGEPFGVGILLNKWSGQFLRVQPQCVLKLSELPEDSLCEITRRIACLHISLDFTTSRLPADKQPPAVDQAGASVEPSGPQRPEEKGRFKGTWAKTCPISLENPIQSYHSPSEGHNRPNFTSGEKWRESDETNVSMDDCTDDDDDDYSGTDSEGNGEEEEEEEENEEEEQQEFELLAFTDHNFPQLELSHNIASQVEVAANFVIGVFLNILYRNQGTVKRWHEVASTGSSKSPKEGQLYRNLTNTESRPGIVDFSQLSGFHLACPFFLHEPWTHLTCLTRPDPHNIIALRVHIAHAHRRPIACPICGIAFTKGTDCDRHIRSRECKIVPELHLEGVTEAQVRQLGSRGTPNLSDAENWFAIWRIVNPLEEPPATPYIPRGMEPFVSIIEALRGFWNRNGETVVKEFIHRNECGEEQLPIDLGSLEALKAAVLDRAIKVLVDRFKQSETQTDGLLGASAVLRLLHQLSGR